jgi:superfamily II DNA or RNA helicase
MARYTETDIEAAFNAEKRKKAEALVDDGRVRDIRTSEDGRSITGKVQDNRRFPYEQRIHLLERDTGQVEFAGSCNCPRGYNCEHVAAVLAQCLALDRSPSQTRASDDVEDWLKRLEEAAREASGERAEGQPGSRQVLLYLVLPAEGDRANIIRLHVIRQTAEGRFTGQPRAISAEVVWNNPLPGYLDDLDQAILRQLSRLPSSVGSATGDYALSGQALGRLLPLILETGRCRLNAQDGQLLKAGERRPTTLAWRLDPDGKQRLGMDAGADGQLPADPPWYLDHSNGHCGPLDLRLPDAIASLALRAPAVSPDDARRVHDDLVARFPNGEIPPPTVFDLVEMVTEKPTFVLRLGSRPLMPTDPTRRRRDDAAERVPVAKLAFDYDGIRVVANDPHEQPSRVDGPRIRIVCRDPLEELRAQERLLKMGFNCLAEVPLYAAPDATADYILLNDDPKADPLDNHAAWCLLTHRRLDDLRGEGWQIEVEPVYPLRLTKVDGNPRVVLGAGGGGSPATVSLDASVDGTRLALLPVLLDLLKQFPNRDALEALPADEVLFAPLPDGRTLAVEVSRLRPLLLAVFDLYGGDTPDASGAVAVAPGREADLAVLEDSVPDLMWLGGDTLRAKGRRLRKIETPKAVQLPVGLNATLRPYQQAGLEWMQFLRDNGFSGILADDMGLGKTVQALAHLLLEKESGRMDRPCLVVAPTSLMHNWRRETNKFAPALRVLTLQGPDRAEFFKDIPNHDIVLTTYPLLPRDEEALTAYEYHLLILDEAQAIKNPSSAATRVAYTLRARHRLCLTGTPLENHLGELWSIMTFLSPGMLGTQADFRQQFRTPIEKFGNADRRRSLANRVRPFLLRRTKDQVVTELPPKTEMVEYIDLEDTQKQLYDDIRLAMHDKVRQAVAEHGLARSRVVILQALMKLRQVCCDPRLLGGGKSHPDIPSAKLRFLMDFLPELVEEGRRILLFSQFTSMLDLIRAELREIGMDHVVLTGDTKDRAAPVDRFQAGEVPLFLISLKAGGVGLNLTAADVVIHYDPWWNPAVEAQATDRAHRLGQDKPVFVYKLSTVGTVEERILAMQDRKRDLAEALLNPAAGEALDFTDGDLEALFAPAAAA